MTRGLFLSGLLLASIPSAAQIRTEAFEYSHGQTILEGLLSYDASLKGPLPGVLIVHDWRGISDYTRTRAEQIASLGYVAFAADVYGKGVRPTSSQESAAEAGKYYRDRALFRGRLRAALEVLRANPLVDSTRVGVMGYCFGGAGALELARSGAPLNGVVTFHGSLRTSNPADAKNIRGKVLVLHGADDPNVKPEDVASFMDEMRAAGVDWQLVNYGGAVHAFTDKGAGTDNSRGAAYNEAADRRSWAAMKAFWGEVFGPLEGKRD